MSARFANAASAAAGSVTLRLTNPGKAPGSANTVPPSAASSFSVTRVLGVVGDQLHAETVGARGARRQGPAQVLLACPDGGMHLVLGLPGAVPLHRRSGGAGTRLQLRDGRRIAPDQVGIVGNVVDDAQSVGGERIDPLLPDGAGELDEMKPLAGEAAENGTGALRLRVVRRGVDRFRIEQNPVGRSDRRGERQDERRRGRAAHEAPNRGRSGGGRRRLPRGSRDAGTNPRRRWKVRT